MLSPAPRRSPSARSEPRTLPRAKRCSMRASAGTAARALASACARDVHPPTVWLSRRFIGAVWSVPCACGTSAPAAFPRWCSGRWLLIAAAAISASARLWSRMPWRQQRRAAMAPIILLGDAPYYARFGFSTDKTGELALPGPFERERLLGLELRAGRPRRRVGHDRTDRDDSAPPAAGCRENPAIGAAIGLIKWLDLTIKTRHCGTRQARNACCHCRSYLFGDHSHEPPLPDPCQNHGADRDDRLRLHRQGHAAADRAALRLRHEAVRHHRSA